MTKPARSFAPVIEPGAKVLILGSMPGVASLDAQQYYAHPRNAFWPIMAELLGFNVELDYESKLRALTDGKLALWDVMQQCQRPGSLDSAIVEASIEPNDFNALLVAYPSIEAIFFNGAKAEQSFRRYVLPTLEADLKLQRLPSTSPAHASLRFEQKLQQWRLLVESLQ